MHFTTTPAPELSALQYAQCRSLNLRGKGAMQERLSAYRANERALVHRCLEDGVLLGWALEFPGEVAPIKGAYFYVRRSHRRRDIGRRLAALVDPKAIVFRCDPVSTAFFDNVDLGFASRPQSSS